MSDSPIDWVSQLRRESKGEWCVLAFGMVVYDGRIHTCPLSRHFETMSDLFPRHSSVNSLYLYCSCMCNEGFGALFQMQEGRKRRHSSDHDRRTPEDDTAKNYIRNRP